MLSCTVSETLCKTQLLTRDTSFSLHDDTHRIDCPCSHKQMLLKPVNNVQKMISCVFVLSLQKLLAFEEVI